MPLRTGRAGRIVLVIASLLALVSGALAAGSGTALAANVITITSPPGNQAITALPATVALSAAATDSSTTPVTLSYAAAPLPPGVTINATTGAIAGTITAAYTGSTTITVTDGTGAEATDTFSWTAADAITVTAPANQTTAADTAITPLPIVASTTGTGQTLAYAATHLPPGLAINAATGIISGTTGATAASYDVTISVTDGTGSPAGTAAFTWKVGASTVTVTSPGSETFAPDTAVSIPVTATDSGGLAVTWSATGLPAGLAIGASTGIISGTTGTDAGAHSVTVTATDTSGASGLATFTWTINLNTITLTTPASQSTPPKVKVSLPVKAVDSARGQVLAYSAAGLPGGLAINAATGLISGTTTTADLGPHTVKVTVTNATSTTATATFAWSVAPNKITVAAPRTEQSRKGVAVRLKITAKDAAAGQKLTYRAANLPPGLAINHATGVISGTPRALFAKTTTVTATDATGSSGAAVIKWQVGGVITIPDPGARSVRLGHPLDVPLTVADNAALDTVKLKVTGLPAGVSMHGKQPVLSGWPARVHTFHVIITARGKDGGVATAKFPVRVRPARAKGPAGAISLDIAGKCLDDLGDRSAGGTPVDIRTCDGGAGQQWTLAEDGTIRVHGQCLQIVGGSVRLEHCTAAAAQTWVKGTHAELANPAADRCLTDPGASTRNGTRPVLAPCTAQGRQRWLAPAGPLLAGQMGSCADDHFSSGVDGNVIDVFACNGSNAQNWQVRADGTLRIFGNKCMTVTGAAGRVGAKIELFSCQAGNGRQHWRIVTHGGFPAEIENGGACLAVPGGTAPAGTQLRLARCPGSTPGIGTGWHDW